MRSIHPASFLLVVIRLIAILGLLACCLPLYGLWRLLGRRRYWPRVFLRGVGIIANLRITCEGTPEHGAFFVANHVSWLDIPALAGVTGTAFVAHDGLAQAPSLRRLCAMNDTVFVARHDRRSVHDQVASVRAAVEDVGALTLFPEGTTGDGTALLPFKSALIAAIEPLTPELAVQPVLLAYREAPVIAWAGDEPGLTNALRILGRWRPIHLTIHFLAPLAGAELKNRKTMADAARERIEHAFTKHCALHSGCDFA